MSEEEEPLTISPIPWDELDARSRRRVELLVGTLTEMEAGYQHSKQIADQAPPMAQPQNHPLFRFMAGSLVNYACGTFMGSTAGAQDVLRSINLGPVADELDAHLAKPVGDHTLRTFIEEHRTTTVAHPTFDPKIILRRVFDIASLGDPLVLNQYRSAFNELMGFTRIVHVLLRKLYPHAATSEDGRWKDGDNPS